MQVLQHTDEQLRQLGQFDSAMKQAEQAAQEVRVKDRKDRWTGHVGMTTRAERRREKKRKATAAASRGQQHKAGR